MRLMQAAVAVVASLAFDLMTSSSEAYSSATMMIRYMMMAKTAISTQLTCACASASRTGNHVVAFVRGAYHEEDDGEGGGLASDLVRAWQVRLFHLRHRINLPLLASNLEIWTDVLEKI